MDGSLTEAHDLPPTVEEVAEVVRTTPVTVESEIVEEVAEVVVTVAEVELHAGTHGVKEVLST